MKEYLGDSVYAEYEEIDQHIKLTTEDGESVSNIIYVDSYVEKKLVEFIEKINVMKYRKLVKEN